MKNPTLIAAAALTTMLLLVSPASAQQVYPTVPDWESADTRVSTGGALVDLDRGRLARPGGGQRQRHGAAAAGRLL